MAGCSGAKETRSEHLITIFNGSVKLPEDYFAKNKAVVLPLKFGRGHPIEGHPVSDVMDPSDITKVHAQISCLSCTSHTHQPNLTCW